MEIQIIANEFYEHSLYFKGFSKATIKRYKYTIDLYLKLSKIRMISEITIDNVRALFFQGRTTRKWSANTAIVFHKSLHVFFAWCLSKGYLNFNPINDIERPKIEEKLPKKLTKQEAIRLLEIVYNYPYIDKFLRYRNHAIFSTFLFAGLRKSELLNLKYADVDIENQTLFVQQGKGAKDRIVPISQTLAKSLSIYIKDRERCKKTCPQFFTSLVQNTGLTEHGLKHFVDQIQTVYPTRFTVHKLRHTFATLMLEGGCDIYSLSRMLGHRDIKTTTIYLYASAEHLRAQMIKHPLNQMI